MAGLSVCCRGFPFGKMWEGERRIKKGKWQSKGVVGAGSIRLPVSMKTGEPFIQSGSWKANPLNLVFKKKHVEKKQPCCCPICLLCVSRTRSYELWLEKSVRQIDLHPREAMVRGSSSWLVNAHDS